MCPTSNYFNSQTQTGATLERRLVEELVVEVIKINGVDVYLIPREATDEFDLIYGEDPLKRFDKSFGVEMYLNQPTGYSGVGSFFSKFGLEIRDDTSFVVAHRSFIRHVPKIYNRELGGPREGDLIWCPLIQTLFEIKNVEEENNFFALGNQVPYYYELTCERFRYNNEKFNVGLRDLEEPLLRSGHVLSLNMSAVGGNGIYTTSEIVYVSNVPLSTANIASAPIQAVVASYNHTAHTLNVAHSRGVFVSGSKVWGANSNASYTIANYDSLVDARLNDIVDNKRIENEANAIIDFTVTNPFGTP
jgi:hypothetical protein